MSSFDNSDDENVRIPDEVIQERLIDISSEENNNDDINIAIQKSLEEFHYQNNNDIDNIDIDYEKIIHQSIIDECERIEKEKKMYETYINEITEKNKTHILQKERQYKYFISKITYIIQDIHKRNLIISIFQRYINLNSDEKYLFLSNNEYILFNKFINYVYNIPKEENRRSPIKESDAHELIQNIKNMEINDFYFENTQKYIQEINNYFH